MNMKENKTAKIVLTMPWMCMRRSCERGGRAADVSSPFKQNNKEKKMLTVRIAAGRCFQKKTPLEDRKLIKIDVYRLRKYPSPFLPFPPKNRCQLFQVSSFTCVQCITISKSHHEFSLFPHAIYTYIRNNLSVLYVQ